MRVENDMQRRDDFLDFHPTSSFAGRLIRRKEYKHSK